VFIAIESIGHDTVDTESLEQALINMTDERSERFRRDHGLIAGRTLGFVGALDAPKRMRS
jgi:hypothetical protein